MWGNLQGGECKNKKQRLTRGWVNRCFVLFVFPVLFAPVLFDEGFGVLGLVLHATHAFHCVVVFLHFIHALTLVTHVGFYFFVVGGGDVDPESRGEVLGL